MHDKRHNTCNIQCHTSTDFCNNGHQTRSGPAYENTTTEGSKTSAANAAYTIHDHGLFNAMEINNNGKLCIIMLATCINL